jgi:hypothetical protein
VIPAVCATVAVVASGCSFLGLGSTHTTIRGSHSDSVFHLAVGDCIIPPTAIKSEVTSLDVVPCHVAHTQEVFALIQDNAGANYPGATALQSFAQAGCLQQFQGYVGIAYEDSALFYTYLLPSVRSWTQDDHTVDCIITTTGQPLTASVRHSRR